MNNTQNPLVITSGVHTMAIRLTEDINNKRIVIIECVDDMTHTQDINNHWIEETESGSFYVDLENIDTIISKLKAAKVYLQQSPAVARDIVK